MKLLPNCRRIRPELTKLESRIAPANVTHYHNDLQSTGVNLNETTLTRTNVNSTTFGKNFQVQVDGQVYAQPLVMQGVNITTGANQGLHDVVFVATEHDTLYAIDATNAAGVILWQRSFLTNGLPGATNVAPVPQSDVLTSDITVEIGITGTPVIDTATNRIYLIAKTKEIVAGTAHYVQRLYAVNMQNGTDAVTPFLIGDTTYDGVNYTNNTNIYVYGTGDGSTTDTYNGTGNLVVPFNALREAQRPALTLVNGVIYAAWASHGDNGPYHGWIVGFDKTDLHLTGVFNTTPNGGLGGIWMAGGTLTFDGTYFYCETGNGTFSADNGAVTNSNPPAPAPGPVTGLNALGFPTDSDYGDSFIKIGLDSSTPTTQNTNGWGLKLFDYFTPFNAHYLDQHDLDVGSAACLVLPDSVGTVTHPHLLIGSGKEGVIYLLDRDNMGKFGLSNNIVQNTANQLSGSLDTAAYYNGRIYYVEGYGGIAKTFTISNGTISTTPETKSADSYAFAGSTPSVSANNNSDGIVWDIDRGTNQLRAYSSDSYATELYTSAQAPNNRDALGAAVKFQVPTVVNGHVYVGSGTGNPNNFLVVYGPIAPPTQPPAAPSNLTATPVSSAQINLSWTNNDTSPNIADSYQVEQSPNGSTGWTQITNITNGANTYAVGGLTAGTTYYFRVRAHDVIGYSAYTATAGGTTNASSVHSINYPTGFTGASSSFTFNNYGSGTEITSAGRLRLTNATNGLSRSAFFDTPQNIAFFTTTFQYTKNGSADGMTFVIQRDPRGLTAIGEGGGLLAYGATNNPVNKITPSFALAINIYSGNPLGTEFLTNGIVDYSYTQTNIDTSLNNTPITVVMTYGAGSLTAQFTQGTNTETKSFNVNLPALLGQNTAYVGFTGATGGANAVQEIVNWTFDQGTPPAMPTNPQAAVTGYTASSTQAVPLGAHVTWNAAPGASSYKIERKLGAGGMYTQIGTPASTSFDDTGLATQSTYYYRVRATNAAGDSAYSSEVSITTPALAPTPTNGQVTSTTTTSIAMQWTDNANNEDGFKVYRAVGGGNTFVFVIALPADTNPAPSIATWTDTGLTAGTQYDYHIQAFNLAGYSDFTGVSTATTTLAPTSLIATASVSSIGLSWTAPTGAATYNIYRAASAGGPFTQIATGIVPTIYTDPSPQIGTSYYQVTAVDLGGESAVSNTANAGIAPAVVIGVAINDGAVYRSVVRSVTLTFDRVVTFTGSPNAAFSLNGPYGTVIVNADLSGSTSTQTITRLTFPQQSSVEYASLKDGRYTLTAFASQITANGASLDGNADGIPGDDYNLASTGTVGVFRLYGDINGDGSVDAADFIQFRQFFGGSNAAFDFDNDGSVSASDFIAFRQRFGGSI
jgi:fibronectin type 3 domain-containing protein